MLSLHHLLKFLEHNSRYYTIHAKNKEGKIITLNSSEISSFYYNIFVERIFSSVFKKLTIELTYEFRYRETTETKDNNAHCEIDLVNIKNRVYIKNCVFVLNKKNHSFEYSINQFFKDQSTPFDFTCIEREFDKINSKNNLKPFKVNLIYFNKEYGYGYSGNNHYDEYTSKFTKNFNFTLCYGISFYKKVGLQNYNNCCKLSKIKNILNNIDYVVSKLNSDVTKTLDNRRAIKYFSSHIDYKFNREKVGINVITLTESKINIMLCKDLIKYMRIIYNKIEKPTEELIQFWELASACSRQIRVEHSYKFKDIYNKYNVNINYTNISKRLVVNNNLEFIISWESSIRKCPNLLNLIYDKELKNELEKFLFLSQ
jgi:hypothetical protein